MFLAKDITAFGKTHAMRCGSIAAPGGERTEAADPRLMPRVQGDERGAQRYRPPPPGAGYDGYLGDPGSQIQSQFDPLFWMVSPETAHSEARLGRHSLGESLF